ncbi:hypothetical protein C8R45DRAFT_359628 [Mycena sanguinolenta]|nr:hypothetical protein C8R45DRAFT_359628 [Mycena sanguinolenta]
MIPLFTCACPLLPDAVPVRKPLRAISPLHTASEPDSHLLAHIHDARNEHITPNATSPTPHAAPQHHQHHSSIRAAPPSTSSSRPVPPCTHTFTLREASTPPHASSRLTLPHTAPRLRAGLKDQRCAALLLLHARLPRCPARLSDLIYSSSSPPACTSPPRTPLPPFSRDTSDALLLCLPRSCSRFRALEHTYQGKRVRKDARAQRTCRGDGNGSVGLWPRRCFGEVRRFERGRQRWKAGRVRASSHAVMRWTGRDSPYWTVHRYGLCAALLEIEYVFLAMDSISVGMVRCAQDGPRYDAFCHAILTGGQKCDVTKHGVSSSTLGTIWKPFSAAFERARGQENRPRNERGMSETT